MPASALDGPAISQYPPIEAERDEDLVISRSKRPALGGQTTAITLHPDNTYTVTGPEWEVGPDQVKNRAQALRVARLGPEEGLKEPEASQDGSDGSNE